MFFLSRDVPHFWTPQGLLAHILNALTERLKLSGAIAGKDQTTPRCFGGTIAFFKALGGMQPYVLWSKRGIWLWYVMVIHPIMGIYGLMTVVLWI